MVYLYVLYFISNLQQTWKSNELSILIPDILLFIQLYIKNLTMALILLLYPVSVINHKFYLFLKNLHSFIHSKSLILK